ncbi:MAG: dienelactone hydrolase family protein, partial [Duncaniella sp.]|nr:dienelactone hydrolase family protein [Duncaniella sp.]
RLNHSLSGDRKEKFEDATPYIDYLMPFVKQYVADHPISKSKIYILGTSMGAAGVWQLIANNPDFFTAAMPASGAYQGKNLAVFQFTPIVCTTGTEENSFNKNKRVIEELQKAGADATFIPLNGLRHIDACNRAFSSQNLDLFFSKHR